MSGQIEIQEEEYLFPYHYIPKWDENFSQVVQMRWGYEYASYMQYFVKKVVGMDWNSMLDVGCGDGRFLHEIYKKTGERRLSGIDYFEPAVNFARIMTKNVNWQCGDIRDNKAFDKKFDLITLIEVLEHIKPDEVKSFLQGIHYHLHDDGAFLVSVPHKNLGLQKKHYQHFDLKLLGNSLSDTFIIEDIYYLNTKLTKYKKNLLRLFSNKHYAVTSEYIVNKFYNYYCNNMLISSEGSCRRIAVVCSKK